MIVHFVGSRYDMAGQLGYLEMILAAIKAGDHKLADDWVPEAAQLKVTDKKVPESLDWSLMYRESVEAISRADVVIAETSMPSFSVGYQVALSVQMKKPTLVLNRAGVDQSFFASGIDTGIEYECYDPKNVSSIVQKFLSDNDIQTKDMRFNFFIDRPIYNYLRWTSLKTGKTKAEILRELVEREIDRDA